MSSPDQVRSRFVLLGASGRLPRHEWLVMSGIRLCEYCAQDEVDAGRDSVCPARLQAAVVDLLRSRSLEAEADAVERGDHLS